MKLHPHCNNGPVTESAEYSHDLDTNIPRTNNWGGGGGGIYNGRHAMIAFAVVQEVELLNESTLNSIVGPRSSRGYGECFPRKFEKLDTSDSLKLAFLHEKTGQHF